MGASMFYRMLRGGLWLKFYTGEWVRCTWARDNEWYIMNPHDGGMFHIAFNGIIEVENYLYGHKKENEKGSLLRLLWKRSFARLWHRYLC